MSEYYDHTGFPSTGSAGLSSSMRAEFVKVETGFSKLPTMAGNGDKAVVVASSGTSLSVTAGTLTLSGNFTKAGSHALTLTTTATTNVTLPTTGTLATLAGSETFTNKTLTAPTISGAWLITTTIQTGHYIGASSALPGMNIQLTKTGGGSSFAYGIAGIMIITGGVSDSMSGYSLASQFTKAASGTHSFIDGMTLSTPTISGSATATNASTLRIINAPTSGATNMYALKVDAGTTSLGGLLDISGASAGQIKFPGTQNASSDVNTLDDYEEGTWTPSLGGTATYTNRNGTYTKIGRMVYVQGDLTVNSIGTGSTTQVSGLPFTSANAGVQFTGAVSITTSLTNVVSIMCQVQPNTSAIIFPAFTAAASGVSTPGIFQNGTAISFSLAYMT